MGAAMAGLMLARDRHGRPALSTIGLLRYWSSIGRSAEEDEEEHGKTVKYHITSITPVLQDFVHFISMISFQHVLHFGVGRSQIEWNMKVKIEISICTGLMLNDHSNPYIESTTVLSDT